MKHYELLYLVTTEVPETELETIQKEITGLITGGKGTATKQEAWGRRKLTYPINKENYGFYMLVEFDIEGAELFEIRKKLELNPRIARYMLLEKKPMSERELLAQERAQKRAHLRKQAEMTKVPVTTKPEPKDETKISLEDLDKKLDEILDTDIIN